MTEKDFKNKKIKMNFLFYPLLKLSSIPPQIANLRFVFKLFFSLLRSYFDHLREVNVNNLHFKGGVCRTHILKYRVSECNHRKLQRKLLQFFELFCLFLSQI